MILSPFILYWLCRGASLFETIISQDDVMPIPKESAASRRSSDGDSQRKTLNTTCCRVIYAHNINYRLPVVPGQAGGGSFKEKKL